LAGSPARSWSTAAFHTAPSDTRKCPITDTGARWKITTRPPTTALPSTQAGRPSDQRNSSGLTSRKRRAPTTATSVNSMTAPVMSRLTNSTIPLRSDAEWGVKLSGSHDGQVEQPSPESVRRTAAPVTMIITSDASVISVIRR
jgi:hypothetical protein